MKVVMGKIIKDLIGAKIIETIEVYDYKQIVTDMGIISLFNPVKCYMLQGRALGFAEIVNELENLKITGVFFQQCSFLKFEINNQLIVDISLKDGDYSGPESTVINFFTGEIVSV